MADMSQLTQECPLIGNLTGHKTQCGNVIISGSVFQNKVLYLNDSNALTII